MPIGFRRSPAFTLLVVALAAGCASPGPAASGTQTAPTLPPKTIVVTAGAPVTGFGSWQPAAGGTPYLNEIVASGLTSTDAVGKREGRLAAKLPSLEDGSMIVLADGRLRATWILRPNVRWHDGSAFTAEDVAFGWQVAADPGIPKPTNSRQFAILAQIERIDAEDPLTAVVTWKTPFYRSLDLSLGGVWPLPKHLLGEAFEGVKQAFLNHAYFTTDFVHLGPFRLAGFGEGENLVFDRFDDYFLGRPKVDRIVAKIIQDPNVLFTNLLAEQVDIATHLTLPYALIVDLRTEWAKSGGGVVVETRDFSGFRSLITQMHPDRARPTELGQDVRVRRGLFFALDRKTLGEAMVPGATANIVTSFMDPTDRRAATVGEPFARYQFDPARSFQELAAAGWQRGADGRLTNQSGERVRLMVRATVGGNTEKEVAIISQFWRELGIEVGEEILPESQARDLEVRAKFSAFEVTAVSAGDTTLGRWDSRIAPTPEGRYVGNNRGSYISPTLDRIIDTIKSTLDEREQARLLKEGGEIIATDLPAMPLYHGVDAAVVRKGVRALVDDFGGGELARNAHLWERE